MKTVRLDFSGGVNVITDKSVLPDKFASIMDNVDLRSGFPRCVKEPIFYRAVDGSSTKQIFSYRGRWITSDKTRDYATEFINGSERIYFTEDGASPKKQVETVEVPLGTPRPTSQPIVSSANNIVPFIEKLNLLKEEVSHRVVIITLFLQNFPTALRHPVALPVKHLPLEKK